VKGLAVGLAAAVIAGAAGAASSPLRISGTVPTGRHPAGVVLAGGSLWVTNDVDNTVSRIDPATNSVTATVKLRGANFPDPSFIAAGEGAIWVVARTTGTVSRLDLRTGRLTVTGAVPGGAGGIALDAGSAWVASFDPYKCSNNHCFSQLTRLDPHSARVAGTYKVDSASGIAVGFGSLWIVDHRSWAVSRFDPRKGKVVRVIPVRIGHEATFEGPEQVVAGLRAVWVSHPGQDTVSRIDPRTNMVAARISLPRNANPFNLAVGAGSIWALGPKQLFRIDPKSDRVIASIRIGKHSGSDYHGLRSVAVADGAVWVTDGDADTVDRIDLGP
jgi:YVTN family beta-propeller protein